MNEEELKEAQECLTFIEESMSCFHAVENVEKRLQKKGFVGLLEKEGYGLTERLRKDPEQNRYYVKRNGSSLIAFTLPEGKPKGFHIMASHSDSPTFKVKCEGEMKTEGGYVRLNVEPYGGMIHATWLDRCLSVAGRIVYQKEDQLLSKTVNVDEDLLVIPNVAIHMNRGMNDKLTYNPQTDLQPLLAVEEGKEKKAGDILMDKVAQYAGVKREDILGKELFLYVREKGRLAGASKELIISPRLDDLACAYGSLKGFLKGDSKDYINVYALFDNEEVGSLTKQGAASTFLRDTLRRISEEYDPSESTYLQLLADSFMISADNAHAMHPAHPEKADPGNRPYLNGGIVIKYHGGQKYTTDAYSEAVMRRVCRDADVPVSAYCNRSDIAGGSTLGNISAGQVSIPCVDIGLAQLAMHSSVETAGTKDIRMLVKAARSFYSM